MIPRPRPVAAAVAAVAVAATLCVVVPAGAQLPRRAVGDIRVFTTLPYPGTPGGVLVDGKTLYVDTSAANIDREFDGNDKIYSFNVDSARQEGAPLVVPRQYPVAAMGLAGLAQDSQGRLYVADMNGRIDRVDPRTGAQQVYATIPTGTDTARPDLPTFIVFGRDGDLYVVLFDKSQLSILRPDGSEAMRFPSPADNAKRDVPLNGPFDLAFNGHGSLLVSNVGDATIGNGPGGAPPPGGSVNAKNWVVFDVWVNDTAAGVPRPVIAS